MALANGESRFLVREITGHLSTQIELVRRFLDVRVELADDGEDHLVSVSPNCT
jgi:RNA 3'-terminal phosphate cyclase